jgi:hypothetical protein
MPVNYDDIKNMNDIAVAVSALEGKKKELSIAQIKEVLKSLKLITTEDIGALKVVLKYLGAN